MGMPLVALVRNMHAHWTPEDVRLFFDMCGSDLVVSRVDDTSCTLELPTLEGLRRCIALNGCEFVSTKLDICTECQLHEAASAKNAKKVEVFSPSGIAVNLNALTASACVLVTRDLSLLSVRLKDLHAIYREFGSILAIRSSGRDVRIFFESEEAATDLLQAPPLTILGHSIRWTLLRSRKH